jgi:hypothetical protein
MLTLALRDRGLEGNSLTEVSNGLFDGLTNLQGL